MTALSSPHAMTGAMQPIRHPLAPDLRMVIPAADKARLNVLFLAKHALADGSPDAEDGNHAVYHHEFRTTLESIGLTVTAADSYDALVHAHAFDFVVPLLNRGGFLNSEMLAPLLLTRANIPFLGASSILRGMADDKHLSKLAAERRGVPTMPWQILRRGGIIEPPAFSADGLVVKPNASSASWGVKVVHSRREAQDHAAALFAAGHDVLIEQWAPLYDVAVPVVGGADGAPWVLPPMLYRPEDPLHLRDYAEKRGLSGEGGEDPLEPIPPGLLRERLDKMVRALLPEFWPFDYGRFEFRYDPATGVLRFMEVNLSCNLWSRKTISRSAATLGISHAELVETIVAHSMARHGLISAERTERAA